MKKKRTIEVGHVNGTVKMKLVVPNVQGEVDLEKLHAECVWFLNHLFEKN